MTEKKFSVSLGIPVQKNKQRYLGIISIKLTRVYRAQHILRNASVFKNGENVFWPSSPLLPTVTP
jgi:hypothetical protein